jgi:hypothetical protein
MKRCVDCKHYQAFSWGSTFEPYDICRHLNNASLVDGAPLRRPLELRHVLTHLRNCGEEGRWWESKSS